MLRGLRDRLTSRAALQVLGASLLYLGYALWVTWPMPTDLRTSLYGPGGDVIGAVTGFREMAQHAFPFLPGRVESLGAPEGMAINHAQYIATWPSSLVMWLGTLVFGAVMAMNLFVLAGFVLTGVSTFLFVRWRIGDPWIAALAGWTLAFLPDPLFNGGTAPDFAHRWVLILLLWRMLVLRDEPTRRNGLLAGAAAVVTVSWNPYYLLIGTVAYGSLVAAGLAVGAIRRRAADHVRVLAWSVLPLVGAAVVYAFAAAAAEQSGVRERGFADLYLYSLRPLEFLNPPDGSLFASLDLSTRDAQTYVYVGLTTFALALAAVAVVALSRAASRLRSDVLTLAWTVVVGVAWAGPPTFAVAGVTIYLPSWFIGQLTTTWRIYGRFSAIVEVGIVLLAAYGLHLLVRDRGARLRGALVAAVAVLVVLDVQTPGLEQTVRPDAPRVYQALRTQPPGAVAEYPIVASVLGPYGQLYRQELHHRPLLNGYDPGTPAEERALSLARLDDTTVGRLRELKIRYVLVDTEYPLAPGDPGTGPVSTRLRLIGQEGPFVLYEVPGAPPVPYAE